MVKVTLSSMAYFQTHQDDPDGGQAQSVSGGP